MRAFRKLFQRLKWRHPAADQTRSTSNCRYRQSPTSLPSGTPGPACRTGVHKAPESIAAAARPGCPRPAVPPPTRRSRNAGLAPRLRHRVVPPNVFAAVPPCDECVAALGRDRLVIQISVRVAPASILLVRFRKCQEINRVIGRQCGQIDRPLCDVICGSVWIKPPPSSQLVVSGPLFAGIGLI